MQPAELRAAIYIHTVSQLKGDSVSLVTEHLQNRARQPQPHSFSKLGPGFPCLLYLTNTTEVDASVAHIPFLNSWHWSWLASGKGLHRPFYCLKAATSPSLSVPLSTTGSEHSWGSSSSKPHFSLLSSLEWSFENAA